MRVNKWLLPILALVLILGTVGVAQAAGWWIASGREMVDLAQLKSGDEVKGWMTLQQVADGTGVGTAALVAKLGLPADLPPETVLKDIEGIVEGFEITAVRTIVDEALGLAPAAEAETAADSGEQATTQETQDAEAEAVASPVPTATTELTAELAADSTAVATAEATAAATPTAAHESTGTGTGIGDGEDQPTVTSADSIKGSHTLQQIVDGTGVDLAALLGALQLPADTDPQTTVRELVQGGKLGEVDEVRTAVAALQ